MSTEARWYSDITRLGGPPHMRRLNRQPTDLQLSASIDLAIALLAGEAGSRPVWREVRVGHMVIVEEYWYWPHILSDTGWWLIPVRIARRTHALIAAAEITALHAQHGSASCDDIISVLRRWRRSNHWRHAIVRIAPRSMLPRHALTYRDWFEKFCEPRKRRRIVREKAAA